MSEWPVWTKTVASCAGIVTIGSALLVLVPVFRSELPSAGLSRVVQLEQKTLEGFGAVQSQAQTGNLANASAWCNEYMRREALARAAIAKDPRNAIAQQDLIYSTQQRELWCGMLMKISPASQ